MFDFKYVLILLLNFSSCASTSYYIFDESIPLEESSVISSGSTCIILQVNKTHVNWKKRGAIEIQIPAGETELIMSVYAEGNAWWGNSYTYVNNLQKINYNFIAGKKYRLYPYVLIEITVSGRNNFTPILYIIDLENDNKDTIFLDKQ